MNAILTSLINLARRTGLFTEEEATAAYNGLWRKFAYALAACAIAFLLNAAFGWKVPSLILAIVFAIVAFYLWAKPLHVLGVAGTGLAAKVVTHKDLEIEVIGVLKIYLELLMWMLIVGGVFLLTTGTFSFKGSPEASFRLLIALGVVGLFVWKWPNVFVGTKGRRFFFGSALAIAVFSFMSIVLGPTWIVKHTGWDPLTAKSTSTEDSLYRLEHARQDIADADRATELERITKKVERREALTQAEERFIVEAQESQSKKPSTPQRATRSDSEGCSKSHPCTASTEKVTIPERKTVCFGAPFPDERLGYITSYKGGSEMKPGCTTASCVMDTFRFESQRGLDMPKYWLVPEGSSQC
jgi:hypothetical protein